MITNKYKNIKTTIDNIKFDSKLEARFYVYLKDNPEIKLLWRQNKFVLQDKFKIWNESIREIYYKCDFHISYKWKEYYIDSKWNKDAVFKLKYKMFLNRYGNTYKLIVCKSIKELNAYLTEDMKS